MLTSYCCDNSVDVDEELLQIHAKSQHIQSDEAVINTIARELISVFH